MEVLSLSVCLCVLQPLNLQGGIWPPLHGCCAPLSYSFVAIGQTGICVKLNTSRKHDTGSNVIAFISKAFMLRYTFRHVIFTKGREILGLFKHGKVCSM